MKKLWLTYAWKDNEATEVDYVIQKLQDNGLSVSFDRRRLVAGQRIWPQLDKLISSPEETDGWAIFATRNSLESEPCQEELAYALDRALRARGAGFPLIGIFPEPIDRSILPSAIATRLYVDLRDPDWSNIVAQAMHGRRDGPDLSDTTPFIVTRHSEKVFEVRLKAGRWFPFEVAVPTAQAESLEVVATAPRGHVPTMVQVSLERTIANGGTLTGQRILTGPVDTMNSGYIFLKFLPDQLWIGGGAGQMYWMAKEGLASLPLS